MCTINLKLHLSDLSSLKLTEITSRRVRTWHDKVSASEEHGKTVVAQSYRFLRAVMNQAVRDELISKNPCNIPGAGSDQAPERQIATPQQLADLLEALNPWYRAPILLAAWCSLRRGEIINLTPEDVDLEAEEIHVRDAKTRAGIRTVKIPPHLVPVLDEARQWSSDQWFFTNRRGKQHVGNSFYRAFERARLVVGLKHLTIHDLRHTGNTYAAAAGATTKDLMKRLGHSSDVAARRYLHTVDGRDAEIAQRLSEIAEHGNPAKLPKQLRGLQ